MALLNWTACTPLTPFTWMTANPVARSMPTTSPTSWEVLPGRVTRMLESWEPAFPMNGAAAVRTMPLVPITSPSTDCCPLRLATLMRPMAPPTRVIALRAFAPRPAPTGGSATVVTVDV